MPEKPTPAKAASEYTVFFQYVIAPDEEDDIWSYGGTYVAGNADQAKRQFLKSRGEADVSGAFRVFAFPARSFTPTVPTADTKTVWRV